MKSIYFQLVGGASGDMLLYSLIGLGAPLSHLKKELRKLNIHFDIILKEIENTHHKNKCLDFKGKVNLSYLQILRLISKSKLEKGIKEKTINSYKKLFEIERKIHSIKTADFKFHHLGKLDTILEICGFYIGLKYLGVNEINVSAFPLSQPAQATSEILKGKKINLQDFGYESITPTAAVLLSQANQTDLSFVFEKCATAYGKCSRNDYLVAYLSKNKSQPASPLASPAKRNERSGGRGLSEVGKTEDKKQIEHDKIIKIEANIDDMNPQLFESLFEHLYKGGAKEVYLEQVIMKTSRPAVVLNVLCAPDDFEKIRNIIFSHTTTFGLRYLEYSRDKLKCKFVNKNTKFGKIKFRVSEPPFKKETPEYADCLAISKKLNIPLLDVYRCLK